MKPLFDKCGGYRKLTSFTFATLIRRTMAMLGAQIRHQGQAFLDEGGFRERLTQCRIEAREAETEAAPVCPECGKPMRQRKAKSGPNAGQAFWGCTAYPACKGTRKAGDAGPKTQVPSPLS